MTAAEYIGLVNLTGGLLAARLFFPFASWVWRDARSLMRISAGLLVFGVLFALMFRGFESLYYGAARILYIEGVDLWHDEPWVSLVAISRAASVFVLLIFCAAKLRADGLTWRRTIGRTSLFAMEGMAIAGGLYFLLIA